MAFGGPRRRDWSPVHRPRPGGIRLILTKLGTPPLLRRRLHPRLLGVALAGRVELQFAEVDRRPREPRQLAGEYGSSEHGEERFDAAELSGEWLFDADADAIQSGEALDDPVNADRSAADVAFKPKCLGIETSIQINA